MHVFQVTRTVQFAVCTDRITAPTPGCGATCVKAFSPPPVQGPASADKLFSPVT
jgi:hypothetical protein